MEEKLKKNIGEEAAFMVENIIGVKEGYLDHVARLFSELAYDETLYSTTKEEVEYVKTSIEIGTDKGRRCVISVFMGERSKEPVRIQVFKGGKRKVDMYW